MPPTTPKTDPEIDPDAAPRTPSESEPAGDLLFDPETADRNRHRPEDPDLSTDAPFEENSATDGDGQ